MPDALNQLKKHLEPVIHLNQTIAVLDWDQQTYMPSNGTAGRAAQTATLTEIAHQTFTSSRTGELLAIAETEVASMDPDSDEARLVKVIRQDYDNEVKIPTQLVKEISSQTSLAHELWTEARQNNTFATFAPILEKIVSLMRQKAEALGYQEHIYDALLNLYEPGFTSLKTEAIFNQIKPALIELTSQLTKNQKVNTNLLTKKYDSQKQQQLTLQVVAAMGFDFKKGRQDLAVHPFCTTFNHNDVRLTTRYDENFLPMGLYSSMHEAGHGLYEQGSPEKYESTFLAGGVSMGIHESQSRMWENLVGRSKSFTQWVFPQLQNIFGENLAQFTADDYYQAINWVHPSYIRVEADEVTYNLHIFIRFELEKALLDGSLAVRDLPAAWNEKMRTYLGITPPSETEGVLQDVHWSLGLFGYFPTYALGNLISAQLWKSINKDIPSLEETISKGMFEPLLGWLNTHIHQYGRKFETQELLKMATGEELNGTYFIEYLQQKYNSSI